MTCKNRESIFAANILDAKIGTTPLLELSGKITETYMYIFGSFAN